MLDQRRRSVTGVESPSTGNPENVTKRIAVLWHFAEHQLVERSVFAENLVNGLCYLPMPVSTQHLFVCNQLLLSDSGVCERLYHAIHQGNDRDAFPLLFETRF